MEEQIVFEQQDIEEHKVHAVLAYLGILVLVPILAAKDSPFAKYHANQGLILLIASVITNVILVVPFIGWIVGPIVGVVLFVFMILGIINAAKGEAKELPIIGKYQIYK